MTAATLMIGGRKFRVIPEAEYRRWQRKGAQVGRRGQRKAADVEVYSPERKAQFLLTNTTDADDYHRACKLVREMGLDPARIAHDPPIGVR